MGMSRKHYEAIAGLINEQYSLSWANGNAALRSLASGLSRYFKEENGNFQEEKFLDACFKKED